MAKLSSGILGGFHGSISIITGRKIYGKSIISRKNDKKKLSYSSLQSNNMSKFGYMTKFLIALYTEWLVDFILVFKPYRSKWNYACHSNRNAFDLNGLSNPENIVISSGKLNPVTFSYASYSITTQIITIVFSSGLLNEYSNFSDRMRLFFYNKTKDEFIFTERTWLRSGGAFFWEMFTNWNQTDIVYIFSCTINHPDKNDSSPTSWKQVSFGGGG